LHTSRVSAIFLGMSTEQETFDAKAKRLMREAGLSYQQTGQKMGFPKELARQMVYRFINGKNPSAAIVAKFAKAVGVPMEDVL